MTKRIFIAILLSYFATSCAQKASKQARHLGATMNNSGAQGKENTSSNGEITFSVVQQLAQTYCSPCHNGSNPSSQFNYTLTPTPEDNAALANWQRGVDAILHNRMPMSGPLSDEIKQIFDTWAKNTAAAKPAAALLDEKKLGYNEHVVRLLPSEFAAQLQAGFTVPADRNKDMSFLRGDDERSDLAYFLGGLNATRDVLVENRATSITTVFQIYSVAQTWGSNNVLTFCYDNCRIIGNSITIKDPRWEETVHQLFLRVYGRRARTNEIADIREAWPRFGYNEWAALMAAMFTSAEAWHVVTFK